MDAKKYSNAADFTLSFGCGPLLLLEEEDDDEGAMVELVSLNVIHGVERAVTNEVQDTITPAIP